MNLVKEIFRESKKYDTCKLFTGNEDFNGIVKLLLSVQGIEYCTKHHFPALRYFAQFDQKAAQKKGIYINSGLIEIRNKKKVFLVGETDAVLKYNNQNCAYQVILMHDAKAKIYADNYALVITHGETNNLKINVKNNALVK